LTHQWLQRRCLGVDAFRNVPERMLRKEGRKVFRQSFEEDRDTAVSARTLQARCIPVPPTRVDR
jgi:hypothetical protein